MAPSCCIAATHGATHTASQDVIHAAYLPHRRHPCCHTWRHSYYDITHGATHTASLSVTHAAVLLLPHRPHPCFYTWRYSCCIAATHGALILPHMTSLMLHFFHTGATHAATHGATHTMTSHMAPLILPHMASSILPTTGATHAAT
jgi:hypothetical protein